MTNSHVAKGSKYYSRGDYDCAIEEFDKAITANLNNAEAYIWKGRAYYQKKDYDLAITEFDKAITVDSNNAEAYIWKGRTYYRKKDYNLSITELDKAIAADPKNSSTYTRRGQAYFLNERYDLSFRDLLKTIELDSKKKSYVVPAYIASQLDMVSEPFQIKSFKHIIKIWEIIGKIKYKLLEKGETATHYTSLDILKELLSGKQFRFYNATYMNDPDEGETFFEIINKKTEKFDINVKNIFYEEPKKFYSPAYIGSFTTVSYPQEDKLSLWQIYGKQKGEDAGGACLIFKPSCFAKKVNRGLGSMQMQEVSTNPCLYKVVYQKNMNDVDGLCKTIDNLADQLRYINEVCLIEKDNDTENDIIRKLVREVLDEIRFLFKRDHYSDEKEMRVVSMKYIPIVSDPKNSDIKEDKNHLPPRLYLNAPKRFHFSKVLLGPKASGLAEWKQWAELKQQERKISIEKSEIPYKG